MIVIFSQNNDRSTSLVIDWLISLNVPYVRINKEDSVIIDYILIKETTSMVLRINNTSINIDDVKSFWYRRGEISIYNPINNNFTIFPPEFYLYLYNERETIQRFIFKLFKEKQGIGDFNNTNINKLHVLNEASKCGLKIPSTYISNIDDVILNVKKEHSVITKAISEAIHIHIQQEGFIMNYTSGVRNSNVECGNHRFPSLIQDRIKKKFEIRSFYLREKFYSMAIFSQENDKTKEDFRNYDYSNPVRTVPFKLPNDIESKLLKLMKKLDLDTGSIDLAVNINYEYIFFEVNPVGQYGMVSEPCNYNLDKIIAEELMKSMNT